MRKSHGGQEVLRDVDLDVGRGEFLAVMGPSGSGKSTLLYAMSGMDSPSAGTVVFDGRALTGLSEAELGELRLHRMGFVFQQVHLLRNLTLLDNVVLPGFLARARPRAEVVGRARALMAGAGVGDLADREVTEASGGQLQRVGISRALVNDPAIIFADEPTGALDSAAAETVLRHLAGLRTSGTTLVVVTHDAYVAAHADRVIAMADGRIDGELSLGNVDPDDAPAMANRHARVLEWRG
ncbi:ABC transporter ATP-binding protein [Georgenia deserti]|uniref:ABC transporter ATP-binding protein n=2 Tax=Georgenia deserti TaxID=2093781 RepID=A0ABW4L389_9MICO